MINNKYTSILNYTNRTRTLEEVAQLLKASLGIRMLKGRKDLWQVKLEKVEILDSTFLSRKYAFVRNNNPNVAMNILCTKLSYSIIIAPDKRVIRLGEIKRGHLYLRLYYEK